MKIELDLTKEEFFEVLDATHKEHSDWRKRDFKPYKFGHKIGIEKY